MTFFSQKALSQLKPIEEEKGIVIYQQSVAHTDSIPQDVIFLPLKEITSEPLEQQFERALSDNADIAIVIYFQGMRWTSPNLRAALAAARQAKGELEENSLYGGRYEVKIALGIIAFEREPLHGGDGNSEPKPVKLKFGNKTYEFKMKDSPAKIGYPMYFKPIG